MKKAKIKKYLPDIFINVGTWIFVYNAFLLPNLSYSEEESALVGLIFLTLGVNIVFRRYLASKV
jgi:hypothetical protein